MNYLDERMAYHYVYVWDPIIHMTVCRCVFPAFPGHDLPCVAMELICEEWELIMAETVHNQLNITMMQETVRVGDAADCGTVL